ncbi:hypothetical protein F2P81_016722 [Scophthalmus maximus]|uniref:Uncharacterized protein n=1 Tax=Scophthalmus maximus TaxID=52904 RepID=A0A6A4SFP7_SCOMX|nr:hypothetical protein F2P81_016722 [Scophthalmus maximus]
MSRVSPGRGMSLLRIKDGKSAAQLVCALISSRRRTVAPAERSEREREGEDLEAGGGAPAVLTAVRRGADIQGVLAAVNRNKHTRVGEWFLLPVQPARSRAKKISLDWTIATPRVTGALQDLALKKISARSLRRCPRLVVLLSCLCQRPFILIYRIRAGR